MAFPPEVLGAGQKRVLSRLGPVASELGFYLGGGTALALSLGHRRSVDLDWFTSGRMADPMRLAEDLRDRGHSFAMGRVDRGTLHGTVAGIRVSFFEYRYPLLKKPVDRPEYGCRLASLDDLACMKLSAVSQRGARKDFLDLYALGLRHAPLGRMLSLYRKKYSLSDVSHVLYALAYFDDAERERMPRMLWDEDWETVKATLRDWVRKEASPGRRGPSSGTLVPKPPIA